MNFNKRRFGRQRKDPPKEVDLIPESQVFGMNDEEDKREFARWDEKSLGDFWSAIESFVEFSEEESDFD